MFFMMVSVSMLFYKSRSSYPFIYLLVTLFICFKTKTKTRKFVKFVKNEVICFCASLQVQVTLFHCLIASRTVIAKTEFFFNFSKLMIPVSMLLNKYLCLVALFCVFKTNTRKLALKNDDIFFNPFEQD